MTMDAVQFVYVVVCIDPDGNDVHHIFSTPEKAQAYIDQDTGRGHVVYDYALDCPERFEGVAQ